MLAKRLFDLAGALAGLLLLAPLMLGIAGWIWCDSHGPVLFRQLRVGRHGQPFHIYKFRTMTAGAEAGGQLSLADDTRVTRAGRVLRRCKLDELPQLFNVLLGQMSLVGPRPEVPRYVAHYPPAVRALVLSVRPGITDWAALRFRHEGDILQAAADPEQAYLRQILPVKLRYYSRYVRRRSLAIDVTIVLYTIGALLRGRRGKAARPRITGWLRRHVQRRQHGAATTAAVHAANAANAANAAPAANADYGDYGNYVAGAASAAAAETAAAAPSALIAWLRGLAALQVAAAHLRAQVFPGLSTVHEPPLWYQALAFITGFAHQAVVIFFVLSGWLVGGALLARLQRPHAMRDYAIDRVTRLWAVLLPAFALMLLLSWGGAGVAQATPAAAWSATTLLGNLVGLQTLLVPVFGDNFPLWSLAYESWYYVLFPLLVLSWIEGPVWRRLGSAGLVLLIGISLDAAMVAYFLVWLLGVAASRLRILLTRWQRVLAWCLLGLLAAGLRLGGQDGDFDLASLGPDLAYATVFVLCLCSTGTGADPGRAHSGSPAAPNLHSSPTLYSSPTLPTAPPSTSGAAPATRGMDRLAAAGAFLAGFSFTLYVVHIPLQRALWSYRDGALLSPHDAASLAVYGAMLAAVVALAYLLHLPCEAQTARLRAAIRRRLAARGVPPVRGVKQHAGGDPLP